ncbi:MAG TPA: pilus assembly protein PilM [Pirellulales bacterium]|jgi:type IV pilus assembly protein PilM|nr:pilus assembly protein PilM [Pirellulales bacterium]
MISRLKSRRPGPIGLDIGSHCVKLIQFNADRSRVVDAVRWDLPTVGAVTGAIRWRQVAAAVRQAREGRHFRGRDVVIGLGSPELFVQNVRVAKVPADEMEKIVRHEAAGRVPFEIDDAEVRFIEAADVRQGEVSKREVILLACQRATLSDALAAVDEAGLRVAAVDVEPAALLRCYARQFRRDEDQQQRVLLAHLGAASTVVVIAKGTDVLFIKYVDVGGRHLDEAVSRHLDMPLSEAAALRRHNGDRRVDQQDPEITRSVAEATRPVVERLASELSLCSRYHSVTFRGQPLSRIVISGGEATPTLVDLISARMDLKCELGDPLRSYEIAVQIGRKGQWDVATGLALRDTADN